MARIGMVLFTILIFSGCADQVDYTLTNETQAVGFWYGLWHGAIALVALVIALFDDQVAVYAVYNSGGWYDFGFIIGVAAVWGGSHHIRHKSGAEKRKEKEWEEVGEKVEKKVMRKLKTWAESEDANGQDPEWKEIGDRVESKLKRVIREWAEKE